MKKKEHYDIYSKFDIDKHAEVFLNYLEVVIDENGIVHYAVANIPGAVPNTSTTALTNATLKYALALADKGWRKACKEDKALYRGLNIVNGKVVFKAVADVFGLEYEEMIL